MNNVLPIFIISQYSAYLQRIFPVIVDNCILIDTYKPREKVVYPAATGSSQPFFCHRELSSLDAPGNAGPRAVQRDPPQQFGPVGVPPGRPAVGRAAPGAAGRGGGRAGRPGRPHERRGGQLERRTEAAAVPGQVTPP
eukprot:scaffold47877_cov34-Prasinocladus_malaysianus.AAC.1